jgi:poly(3-hydroxybutyrate) depolymerase
LLPGWALNNDYKHARNPDNSVMKNALYILHFHKNTYRFWVFLTLALFSCNKNKDSLFDSTLSGNAGTFENNTIIVDGDTRKYRLVVPEKLNLHTYNKIIFAFHGMGVDNKDLMPVYSELNSLAENLNAIIVYPNSQHGSWGLSQKQTEKDLRFFTALLKKIQSHYTIDEKNIHIVGMSNGAYFCHILAKNNSEKIASVSAHSGMIGFEFMLGINANIKYPILLIHGEKDPIFNINTAKEDFDKYKNESHKAKLIVVSDLGHEWAKKININDSILLFIKENPLQ